MRKICLLVVLLICLLVVLPVKAANGANFGLSPASGNYTNGTQFDVVITITTGTNKMYAADVWMTFDASKLEIINVTRAYDSDSLPADKQSLRYFEVVKTAESINNTAGTMKISVQNLQSTSHDAIALTNQPMIRVTFKGKATGTASVNFTCSQGSVNDSNIIDAESYEDIITCSSNQSGLYTIDAGSGGSTSDTTTTSTTTTTTTSSGQLPQTGVLEYTIGFGLLAIILLAFSGWMFWA